MRLSAPRCYPADARAERASAGGCHDCGQAADRYCAEHQGDLDTAARYRQAAAEIEREAG